MKKKTIKKGYYSLVMGSILVGILATLLGYSLKKITAFSEEFLIEELRHVPFLYIIAPVIGISLIYLFRKYLFRGRKNKGIKEIFQTLKYRKDELPFYKVPSHYINGFFTVVFGGSTGIEVSTVVATAALGASIYRKESVANIYKTELVSAGVAAGITVLFGSPIAGFLFAVEVISRKLTKTMILSCAISAFLAWIFVFFFDSQPLFDLSVTHYKVKAIPFMIVLSLLAGMVAVYFTKSVIFIKERFSGMNKLLRVLSSALLLGVVIFFLPALYGDSYHALVPLITAFSNNFSMGSIGCLFLLVLLKPLAASITLGGGGDGGVFAPSIVTGAFLGIMLALFCNYFFGTHLIVLNFALIGAAAMLSAAIHAPLTALFLTCNIVAQGFILFLPVLLGVFVAKQVAVYLCEYNVYTYRRKKPPISFR
ncbi:chloride channel protein [Christiangramia flava]|uniref:Chloride channel protein n=1 Tax=Christiangramia flava JLT2011 TaxID=1229726 RepID=A0A1L7I1V4_9FLAO|nr:chloride channel protein [Christiangramia flava]APU67115.1 Chloride channel protein [Christiangramia flava JLT2011]OSS38113.1 Cl- channel, voltage-gated family protein [Christiangramia flava JLT2011]